MVCPAPRRAAVYRPRWPGASPLGQLLDRYFDEFQRVYDERYQQRYGFWRPVIASTIEKFLACGDPPQADFRAGALFAVSLRVLRRLLLPSMLPLPELSPEASTDHG